MSKRPIARARRKPPYITKYEEILSSPAYRDLNCVERCLLEELQRIYRPSRNGRIGLSVRRAAQLLKVNKDTASRSFKVLQEHGFIAIGTESDFLRGRAREWRLTFEMCDGREPTDEWKLWSETIPPSDGRGQRVPDEGTDCLVSRVTG